MAGREGTDRVAWRPARGQGERVIHHDGLAWLARAGLLARGCVYGIIGLLAIKLALGSEGRTTNQTGALETIARQPLGKLLLGVLAVGLAGYAAWRLLRAAIGHGTREADGSLDRLAAAGSGLAYGALCVAAVEILSGGAASGGASAPKSTTAGVLGWSGGQELVAIAGASLIGVALYQGYRGVSRKFMEQADTARMNRGVRRTYAVLGTCGHLARMVVFGLSGYGLLIAAIEFEPHRAVGLDGAQRRRATAAGHRRGGPDLLCRLLDRRRTLPTDLARALGGASFQSEMQA